jgi:hypothetical protein
VAVCGENPDVHRTIKVRFIFGTSVRKRVLKKHLNVQ